jgi:tRNA threonylcarbamoyladenosine biosynthesis protein TsaE
MTVDLPHPSDTEKLARRLARALLRSGPLPVLLQGGLGSGKTSLVRGMVHALPGGRNAQVSSPSFNILNLYPTVPETAHIDLYRLEETGPDESVLELLASPDVLAFVEWPEHLPEEDWPEEYLLVRLSFRGGGRLAELIGRGSRSDQVATEAVSM